MAQLVRFEEIQEIKLINSLYSRKDLKKGSREIRVSDYQYSNNNLYSLLRELEVTSFSIGLVMKLNRMTSTHLDNRESILLPRVSILTDIVDRLEK